MEYTHLGSEPGHAQRRGTAGGKVLQPMVPDVPPLVRASPPQGMSASTLTYLMGGGAYSGRIVDPMMTAAFSRNLTITANWRIKLCF